jgi:predicted dehydrogenase
MGRGWGRNLVSSDRAELAGFVDIVPGKAKEACEESGAPGAYHGTSLVSAISEIRPDFVVDVTIPEAHCETVVTALNEGCPVLGEKPMADSMEAAQKMLKASRDTGLLYMVSQSRRYLSHAEPFRQAGAGLGPLMGLYADFFLGPHFGGFRDEMDSPLVLDMAIHTFDQARQYLGSDPVAVYADEFNPDWSWYRGDACANIIFEMEGGVRFVYRGSWCAEGSQTSWDAEWRMVGRDGWIFWDGGGQYKGEMVTGEPGSFFRDMKALEFSSAPSEYKGGIEGSLAEFLDALENGSTPQGEASDNIKSLAMVFGAIKSSREKRRVEISEVLAGS